MAFIERARDWPLETLPVPADLLLYTAREWEALHARDGRFARVLAGRNRLAQRPVGPH